MEKLTTLPRDCLKFIKLKVYFLWKFQNMIIRIGWSVQKPESIQGKTQESAFHNKVAGVSDAKFPLWKRTFCVTCTKVFQFSVLKNIEDPK
jgi:hypothetical protein